jgi:hypothetical protein
MLAILKSKAARLGLNVNVVQANAADLPPGETFDAVVEPSNPDSARARRGPGRMAQGSPDGPFGTPRGDMGKGDRAGGRAALGSVLIDRILRAKPHKHDHYPAHPVRRLPRYVGGLPGCDSVEWPRRDGDKWLRLATRLAVVTEISGPTL